LQDEVRGEDRGERSISKEFYGFLEPTNGRMTALCEKLGMTRSRVPDDLVRVSLPLVGC